MAAPRPSPSLRALVTSVVDFAGLFPPAALPMTEAVARQARYHRSPDAWMLGRFVVPVSRLDELVSAAASCRLGADQRWRLSVLIENASTDAARVRAFSRMHGEHFIIEAVEGRAASDDEVARMLGAFAPDVERYVEVSHRDDPRALLDAVRRAGGRAKIRTGGVIPGAFPAAAEIVRFLMRCVELELAFKATAGLHHAVNGDYRVTYDQDAQCAPMFGFLNLFAASVLAATGVSAPSIIPLLEERDGGALAFDVDGMRWREHSVSTEQIALARRTLAVAFGSCSFEEPRDELRELGLL